MKDEELISLIKRDPDRGMRRIIKEYGGLVRSVIRARLSAAVFGEADIEDCAAETLLEFWTNADRYIPAAGGIKTYLCVMARRNAVDLLRKRYKELDDIPLDEAPPIAASGPDAAERLALIEAVKSLGNPDSEIIIRKYYLGQSSKEIAKCIRMSVSNVDTRAHRAIAKLRNIFGGEV